MTTETLPPPRTTAGPLDWLRQNLFSGVVSSIVTLGVLALVVWVVVGIGGWAVGEARWDVITANLRLFLIGQYPVDQAWRLWLNLAIISVLSGLSAAVFGQTTRSLAIAVSALQALIAGLTLVSPMGALVTLALAANAAAVWIFYAVGLRFRVSSRPLVIAWIATIPLSYVLIYGVGLPQVGPGEWGGLLLTVLLALVGIVLSFPLGVLLALGRRSSLPAARILSTGYIELIRGVPLITLLFMADLMLPLLLPGELRIDRVVRAMGGITLFSAAYVAENVRGGLQAIPTGQIEASNALGLNAIQTNLYIVLPQALRSVIPANVGLFELLGIGRAILAQPESLGAHLEVYTFVAAVFFVLCYAMSQASYRLERSLGVGTR